MYKLLIVEDEEIVRWGLRNEINWEEFGFNVVGEAENGIIALDLITKLNPDAILLDIRMPLMNGIEFMSRVHNIKPQIKIVVLSAHDNFEYARQSIECGVFSYLLKPTKEEKIKEVFLRLKNEIEKINVTTNSLKNVTMNNLENIEDAASNNNNVSDQIIQKVLEYMNENYNKKITLEKLSELVYMNPSYFSVYFKQKTGQNYIDYLTNLRIEKAKELLQNTDCKIYEIATMVGYDDFRYFSRLFKKSTGVNAFEYRKLLAQ